MHFVKGSKWTDNPHGYDIVLTREEEIRNRKERKYFEAQIKDIFDEIMYVAIVKYEKMVKKNV